MKDLITTTIKVEVLTKITGLKRFNEIEETHIFTKEENMSIVVKYNDYHVDNNGNKFDVKNNFYKIVPNPNGLPLVAPEDNPEAEVFNPANDEYFGWVNGATGEGIALAQSNRLKLINGVPK